MLMALSLFRCLMRLAVADAAEILRRQDAEKASAALAGTVDRAWNDRLIVQKGIEKLGCMWNA